MAQPPSLPSTSPLPIPASLTKITWSQELTFVLILQMEKPENFRVLFGKQDKDNGWNSKKQMQWLMALHCLAMGGCDFHALMTFTFSFKSTLNITNDLDSYHISLNQIDPLAFFGVQEL
ncbi:hypothetical protein PC9H_010934 [Pleurotus ostreatus]|uniref:Uncharacterized protein n=1 Tax=Pleurotus ostreatus TaxID=5322 RepID=A0A8H7DQ64_PLEOS|nr:uncharacterized protein PC9H_010934 [Pleurotus ostreatus]KAF7422775.1 hypothetical protein PC9H_010934 [Pleurotus ostreatus]